MEGPTNRELKIMLDNQSSMFAEKHEDVMRVLREVRDDGKETKMQAFLTNGKVKELTWWKKAFLWALGAVWTLLILLAPIVYFIMKHEIERSVNSAVNTAFDTRVEKVNYGE